MAWTRRWRKRLRALVRQDAVEQELDEELAFHLAMEVEKNLRAGMGPEAARRQARIAFGAVEVHKEAVRDARWLGWAEGLKLDLKLGARMLRKNPGLTLVGGIAVTVATGLGAALFEFSEIYNPRWPFPEPDRIVGVRVLDPAKGAPEPRALHQLGLWQEEARTFETLGGFIRRELALTAGDARAEVVEVAQISAGALAVPRVPPLLGRPLMADDERPGAAPVVVLARDVWERLFDGDPNVIGQTVRVGTEPATLVGVMPAGFRFPFNQEAWIPLPSTLLTGGPGAGPPVSIVGRLRRGVSPGEAEAELTALAAADPALTASAGSVQLRPRVLHLTEAIFGSEARWLVYGARLLFLLLMATICINIATLVFARAATRGGEIAVRTALGASRRRIATQMFVEGLVLMAVPAAIGLAIAAWAFPRVMTLFWQIQEMPPPFWADGHVSIWTAAYVGGLALFGAIIVGVIPALKATGRRLQPRLSRLTTGGWELRFGGIWTVVIVIQVAVAVALLPFTLIEARAALRDAARASGFPAERFLTGRIAYDDPAAGAATGPDEMLQIERARRYEEVLRRVAGESGVAGAAYASTISGMNHPVAFVELEGASASPDGRSHSLRRLDVDSDFLHLVGARIVSGRSLQSGDFGAGAGPVLVNEEFVRELVAGRDPVGMRIRYAARSGDAPSQWYEIVGVVGDLEMDGFGPGVHRAVYHPLEPGSAAAVQLFVRLTEPAPAVAPQLLGMVSSLDPRLQVSELRTVREAWRASHTGHRLQAGVWIALAAIALLLSMAGLHAMMSFLVSQRRREIGIRSALGAGPKRIIGAVFSRALAQVGLGVLVGWVVASPAIRSDWSAEGPMVFVAVGAILLTAGVLACFRPAWRALRVEPTEALRAGG
jgi:putative ABC transport system permease protein